jgi:hypothetical protein
LLLYREKKNEGYNECKWDLWEILLVLQNLIRKLRGLTLLRKYSRVVNLVRQIWGFWHFSEKRVRILTLLIQNCRVLNLMIKNIEVLKFLGQHVRVTALLSQYF